MKPFSIAGKILILRETRLGHLPPALHAAEILVEAGFPVLVFECGEGKSGKIPGKIPRLRFHPRITTFLPRQLKNPFLLLTALCKLSFEMLWQGRPALLVTHGLFEQALALWLHWLFRVPYVCHLHEIYNPEDVSFLNRLLLRLEKSTLERAAFSICPEPTRREILLERYGTCSPIHFVPNCPRKNIPEGVAAVRSRLGLSARAVLVLYMGGIGKNIPVREWISALAAYPEVHALLAGWGDADWLATLKDEARDHGVSDRVHFLGMVEDRFAYYRACDIAFCVYHPNELRTRYQATASNKLFEAMATGKPVVVRDTPDFQRMISENECGVACDISVVGIRTALSALLESESYRNVLGANGRRAFLSRYHYENFFLPLLPVFRSAASSGLEASGDLADLPS